MDPGQWLTLVTCAGLLAVGIAASLRMRTSSLAGPLAAVCLISFCWNFAVLAHSLTNDWRWIYFDRAMSPWTVPASLHFVLVFVGKRMRWRWLAAVETVGFGALSVIAAAGFVSRWARLFAVSSAWDNTFAGLVLINTVACSALLARHLWTERSAEERMRTRLVISAVIVGALLAIVELLLHNHIVMPSMLVTLILLTIAAFRLRMFSNELTTLAMLYGISLLVIAGGSSFIVIRTLAPYRVLSWLAILAIGASCLALMIQAARAALEQRARVERLAILGKFSEQMAHDLKNPLAALKGAAQFLAVESKRGVSIAEHSMFLDLLITESEHLSRLIDKYSRLGSVQLSRVPVEINDLVKRLLQVHSVANNRVLATKLDLDDSLPMCSIDEDLAETAIENLLRNATEAMRDGGTLVVRTSVLDGEDEPSVAITIEDSGCGMDARELDQAFNEFFTTKPTGSGLGLPMVKRVVEAHGGSVKISSTLGVGTKVRVVFPVSPGLST